MTVEDTGIDSNITDKQTKGRGETLDGAVLSNIEVFYVGGVPDGRSRIKGMKSVDRFVGCLRNVVFSTDKEKYYDHYNPFQYKFSVRKFEFSKWTQLILTNQVDSLPARKASEVKNDFKLQSTPKGKIPSPGCGQLLEENLSFITSESFVKIDPTRILEPTQQRIDSWAISFDFRTNQRDGLLLTTASAYQGIRLTYFSFLIFGAVTFNDL